jgi:hypothetical protein
MRYAVALSCKSARIMIHISCFGFRPYGSNSSGFRTVVNRNHTWRLPFRTERLSSQELSYRISPMASSLRSKRRVYSPANEQE